METLCASRSVRPPYRPRRGAGGCRSEQQTETKASRAQRGHGPAQAAVKRSTTSAAIQKAGRQGTSTEPPLMPTQPSPDPWNSVGG